MSAGVLGAARPLRRSRRNRMIGGVCGGLAEWLGWTPRRTRIVFVLVSIFPAVPGILLYLLLWLFIPLES